jgi:YD repeat-containing protein
MKNKVAANAAFVDLDGDGYPDAVSGSPSVSQGQTPIFAKNLDGKSFGPETSLPVFHTGATGPSFGWFAGPEPNGFTFGNWAQMSGAGTDAFYDATITNGDDTSGFYVPQPHAGVLSLIDSTYGQAYHPPSFPYCYNSEGVNAHLPYQGVADIDGDGLMDCWSIPPFTPSNISTISSPYVGLTRLDPNGAALPYATSGYPVIVLSNFRPAWNLTASPQAPNHTINQTAMMTDMTGDGIPDLVWFWNSINTNTGKSTANISVIVGKGDGFFGAGFTMPMPACADEWPQQCAVTLVDLNGDGFADFVAMDAAHTTVILSAGVTTQGVTWGTSFPFAPAPFPGGPNAAAEVFGPESADLHATGVADLIYVSVAQADVAGLNHPLNGFEPGTVNDIDLLSGASTPLLKTVSNGLGATTTLNYASSASLGRQAAAAGHPWTWNSTQPVQVLTSLKTQVSGNGAAGGPFETTFEYYGDGQDGYAGAMYDKRFRRFNGFGFVRTKLTDESSPGLFDVTDTYYAPSLSVAASTPDTPWDVLKGLPLFSARYAIDANAKVVQPLSSSHTTYQLTRLYRGLDGRMVRQVAPVTSDTWVYDGSQPASGPTATFASLQDVDDQSGGAVSLSRQRAYPALAWQYVHLQSSVAKDGFGNPTEEKDSGVVGKDPVIIRTTQWKTTDGVWTWRPSRSSVAYGGQTANRRFDFAYSSTGQLLTITGNLSGSLPLQTDTNLIPVNASPAADPALVLSSMAYDPVYGNLTRLSLGGGLRSTTSTYDQEYDLFLVGQSTAIGGRSPHTLTKSAQFDPLFQSPAQLVDANASVTAISYDIFGRVAAIRLPDPAKPGIADTQNDITVSYSDVQDGPFQRIDVERQLGRVAEGHLLVDQVSRRSIYTDALQNTAAVVSSGGAKDAPGQWIVSRAAKRDARGEVQAAYEPFFATLTNGLPGGSPPDPPGAAAYRALHRDGFQRLVEGDDLDGSVIDKFVYRGLARDTYTAKDLQAGASHPTFATETRDGRGRILEVDQRTANAGGLDGHSPDTIWTRLTYLATGEVSTLTRGSTAQGAIYNRWMQYDSLGRRVLNVEPNTAAGFVPTPSADGAVPAGLSAWTYAYDAAGDLVGAKDARGCEVNYAYDGAGRQTSQDYIPCAAYQPAHTPVDPNTGAGAEVFNVYDMAEPDEPDANSGGAAAAPFLMGKLAATRSRGEHTQYQYDGRGRVVTTSSQAPNPPAAVATSATAAGPGHARVGLYADTWYRTALSYDQGDRVTGQSTGATATGLLGSGGASVVTTSYDARNIPQVIGGSYGILAQGEQRDADGRLLSRVYGDLAGTTANLTYDSRKRLSGSRVSRAAPPLLWGTARAATPRRARATIRARSCCRT